MIHIDKDYATQSDEKQYILVKRAKRVDKETGETCWDALGYHGSPSDALLALSRRLHREQVKSTDMSFEEAVRAYREISDRILGVEGNGGLEI